MASFVIGEQTVENLSPSDAQRRIPPGQAEVELQANLLVRARMAGVGKGCGDESTSMRALNGASLEVIERLTMDASLGEGLLAHGIPDVAGRGEANPIFKYGSSPD